MATTFLNIELDMEFPVQIGTWTVSLSSDKQKLIVVSTSKASGKNKYVFPFKEGRFGFYNGTGKKYCYFREKEFSDFLEKYGLTKVIKENPNRKFELRWRSEGRFLDPITHCCSSDGTVERIIDGYGSYYNGDLANYDYMFCYKVTNATWVVLATRNNKGDHRSFSRILYTLQNPMGLELPEKFPSP